MMEIICIVCPNGCRITVDGEQIKGNLCPRGRDFALTESKAPVRTVTTTVNTTFASCPALSVRADNVPKAKIVTLLKLLADVTVTQPLKIGDSVLSNVWDSGINVIATKNLP